MHLQTSSPMPFPGLITCAIPKPHHVNPALKYTHDAG
jgi:hypothetical protein